MKNKRWTDLTCLDFLRGTEASAFPCRASTLRRQRVNQEDLAAQSRIS